MFWRARANGSFDPKVFSAAAARAFDRNDSDFPVSGLTR